jgi:protein TonB
MFQDSFIIREKNITTKVWLFPLSLTLHLLIVLLLIIYPLLNPGSLPQIEIYSAFLAPPPLPPPPPPPPPKKREGSKKTTRIRPVQAQTNIEPGKLVAPVEIPEEIAEEELSDIGIEGGIEGGVEGGVVGGVLGGVVGEVESPIRAVGETKQPKLIKKVDPIYPEIARQARVDGTVIIDATTDIYGKVANAKIIKSIPLLDQAAVDAVRQWVYEPMIINGRPRSVIFVVTVIFNLR